LLGGGSIYFFLKRIYILIFYKFVEAVVENIDKNLSVQLCTTTKKT